MIEAEPTASASSAGSGAYRVLARKYRPQTFADLIGQDAMVRTLANAIDSGRLAHAWLMTGVRGVGKTSTARLIAKALNCTGADGQGGPTINPCGVCDSCRAIAESRHIDVIEMDAASRTGVDDVREIIDAVRYAAVSARYKVYIVDEVHMLSRQAFNALLKTLEEPPPHVKFVFATTEIRKVPITVLSRCQRFDLKRIPLDTLIAHFGRVLAAEGIEAVPEALRLIAIAAEGSVRDGLSLLDQAIAHGQGMVDAGTVQAMLGLADRARVLDLMDAVLAGEPAAALANLRGQYEHGADPATVIEDLMALAHLITRARIAPEALAELPETDRGRISAWAGQAGIGALARLWQMLLKGLGDVQAAPSAIDAADMVIARVTHAALLPDPADLLRRRDRDESTQKDAPAAPERPSVAEPGLFARAAARQHGAPASFEALVALFEERNELILASLLHDDARLVRYAPPLIDLAMERAPPRDFAHRLMHCLESWTGQRWTISFSSDAGAPTLRAQADEQAAAARAAALADPLVQAALAAFPDADILHIGEPPAQAALPRAGATR